LRIYEYVWYGEFEAGEGVYSAARHYLDTLEKAMNP